MVSRGFVKKKLPSRNHPRSHFWLAIFNRPRQYRVFDQSTEPPHLPFYRWCEQHCAKKLQIRDRHTRTLLPDAAASNCLLVESRCRERHAQGRHVILVSASGWCLKLENWRHFVSTRDTSPASKDRLYPLYLANAFLSSNFLWMMYPGAALSRSAGLSTSLNHTCNLSFWSCMQRPFNKRIEPSLCSHGLEYADEDESQSITKRMSRISALREWELRKNRPE